MRIKDLEKIAGTDTKVAVTSSDYKPAEANDGLEAVVIAPQQDHPYFGSAAGVRVRYVANDREEVVKPRQVIDLWENYIPKRDARMEARYAANEARKAHGEHMRNLALALGDGATAHPEGTEHGYVALTPEAAERIADQLREATELRACLETTVEFEKQIIKLRALGYISDRPMAAFDGIKFGARVRMLGPPGPARTSARVRSLHDDEEGFLAAGEKGYFVPEIVGDKEHGNERIAPAILVDGITPYPYEIDPTNLEVIE